jgi:elongation factor Ts
VSEEDVPEADLEAERRVLAQQADDSKPAEVQQKMTEGRLRKWLEEVVLLKQPHVHADKHQGQTIEQLRAEISSRTGENIVIRRFARFQVGG